MTEEENEPPPKRHSAPILRAKGEEDDPLKGIRRHSLHRSFQPAGAPVQQNNYHCVHCMTSASSTYRQFGQEIKLTTCERCGDDVDPYVERDWLLVAMDCVLMRDEAYRHVLGNRGVAEQLRADGTVWKYLMASAILQGYLLLQEQQQSLQCYDGSPQDPSLLFLTLLVQLAGIQPSSMDWWIPLACVAYAFVGNILFLLGMQLAFALSRGRNASRLSLALLLPTAFYGPAILIMVVWENTSVVRKLASLLVLCYQYLTTTVALQLQLAASASNKKPQSRLGLVWVFVAGLVCRAFGLAVFRWLWKDIPCLLGVDVGSLLGGGRYLQDWKHWSVCLC